MPELDWYALSPCDPADPRWPLPETPQVRLKAEDEADARRRFAQAYPSMPDGTPGQPLPNRGAGAFRDDGAALLVEVMSAPPAPEA